MGHNAHLRIKTEKNYLHLENWMFLTCTNLNPLHKECSAPSLVEIDQVVLENILIKIPMNFIYFAMICI